MLCFRFALTLLREVRLRFGRKNENFLIFILSFSHLALTLLREVRLHLSKAKFKKIPFFILLCFRFALLCFAKLGCGSEEKMKIF